MVYFAGFQRSFKSELESAIKEVEEILGEKVTRMKLSMQPFVYFFGADSGKAVAMRIENEPLRVLKACMELNLRWEQD